MSVNAKIDARIVIPELERELAQQAERIEVLEFAARNLIERMDEIHDDPSFKSVWMVNQLHTGPYTGPRYDHEFEELRAALSVTAAPPSPDTPTMTKLKRLQRILSEDAPSSREAQSPDNDMVICPGCVHQFRAIPVNVQSQLAQLQAAVDELIAADEAFAIIGYNPQPTIDRLFAAWDAARRLRSEGKK